MRIKIPLVFLALISIISTSFSLQAAEETTISATKAALSAEYAGLLPSQLLALPDMELDEKVSSTLILAAQDGANPRMRPVIAMRLGTLMYPASSNFELAVKDYQIDLGANATGNLTVGQLDELHYRSAISKLEHVKLTSELQSFQLDQVVRIRGSMRGFLKDVVHPINRVQIICYKSTLSCSMELLQLQIPTRESTRRGYRINLRNRWDYEVLRWEKDYMVLERITDSSCAVFHLNLNFSPKLFRERPVSKSENCKWEEFEEQELNSNWDIVDGMSIQSEEFAKIKKESTKFLAKKFKKKMALYLRSLD